MTTLEWFAYFDDNKDKFEWFCKPYLLSWSMIIHWRYQKNKYRMIEEMEHILGKLEEAKFDTDSD